MRRARPLLAFAAVALFALALRAPVADIPFERDEGEYAYLAWRWLEGDVPYRDGFDQKPPAVLAVYAALLATVGGGPRQIHFGATLYTLATLALLLSFGARTASLRVGASAAALCALGTTVPGTLGNAANVELFALLPIVGAALAAQRGSERGASAAAALAGAAAGAALAFKPVTAPYVLFALALLLLGRAWPAAIRARLLAAFACGGLACWLPILAYFAGHGALGAFYDATVRFNLGYATQASLADYPVLLRMELPFALRSLWPLVVAAAFAPLARRRGEETAPGSGLAWAAAWLASGMLAASAGGYFRAHYVQLLLPPLALLAALGLDGAARALRVPVGRRGLALAAGTGALTLLSVAATPWYFAPGDPDLKARRIYGRNPFPESPELAALLAARSAPDETVFVFGSEPQVLFEARRRHASRYVLAYHYLMGDTEAMRKRQAEVIAALRAAPPRLLVGVFLQTSLLEHPGTPSDLRRELAALAASSYRPIAVLPPARGVEVAVPRTDERTLEIYRNPFLQQVNQGTIVVFERRPDA